MAGDLRSVLRTRAQMGTRRVMPVAVSLVVLVILAAGIGGTSDFTGARWFPKFHGSYDYGVRTGIPMPPTGGGAGQQAGSGNGGSPAWVIVLVCVLGVVALTVSLWRWWRSLRPSDAPEPARPPMQVRTRQMVVARPEPEPTAETLLTGIELASEVLHQGREPADAVVRAWLDLQETAEESGIARREAETPTEFTARILSGALVDDRAVRTLLRLYLQARFGDHPVTEQDVLEVREALQQLAPGRQTTGGAPAARTRG